MPPSSGGTEIKMRVLLTGGGTGGHINPAIAIAKKILLEEPRSEIAFVGTPFGMENRLIPKEGFKLYHIEIRGLQRSLSLSNLKTAYLSLTSVHKAKKLIRKFKPDICIGTGGYVSWPLMKAASDLGIPTALHESNALAGVAVKMLSRHVDIIFTNFKATENQLPKAKKVIHVGNPMKNGFDKISREDARRKLGFEGKYRFSLLTCGGSLGAEAITNEVLSLMQSYTSKHPEIHHLHQAGVGNYNKVREKFVAMGLNKFDNIELVDYIYDMPERLSAADVVVNRAGAMTISELALLGKASILIPSPNVTDNHQYKNAKVLSDAGAVIMIEESMLNGKILENAVDELLSDREKRRVLAENFAEFALRDASDRIYSEIKKLTSGKSVL